MSFTKSEYDEIKKMIKEAMAEVAGESNLKTVRQFGDNVEVLKLKCGLTISLEDYWEIDEEGDKKTNFTFEEAIDIERKTHGEWRVPTLTEWAMIVEELACKEDGFDPEAFGRRLKLVGGCYWSATAAPGSNSFGLDYNGSELYPAHQAYRDFGWGVRCVKGDNHNE